MTRDDWIGLGTSVGAHGALLLLFAFWSAGRPEVPVPGALQVELGAFAEGRPVQQAAAPPETPASEQDASPSTSEPTSSEAPRSSSAAPEQSAPVDLPEQQPPPAGDDPPPEDPPDEQQDAAPVPDASTPDSSAVASAQAPAAPDTAATDTSRAAGAEEAASTSGAAAGEEGDADDEEKAAPFDIEGLDRTRLHGRLPQYTEKVNATIKVEITVSPQGRVVGQRLLQKANPSLERSVLEALRQWRFDRLPSGAPQENQTGVVTFRFRLE